MIVGSVRGGISCVFNQRVAVANNCYHTRKNHQGKPIVHKLSEEEATNLGIYNPNKPKRYIIELDQNNQYGLALMEKLPIGDYEWIPVDDFDIATVDADGDYGYIVECDINIPEDKVEYFKDFPPCPINQVPNVQEFSEYQTELIREGLFKTSNCSKLMCTLKTKLNYVDHIKTLKLYQRLGVQIPKIHRILRFRQKAWLKPFIEFNTEKRKQAAAVDDDFEVMFFKLMNNSAFGKQMENPEKRVRVELVNSVEQYRKLVRRRDFHSRNTIVNDLISAVLKPTNIKCNKPLIGGFTVLCLSKMYMYDFYYNVLKKEFGPKVKLIVTDTDSFKIIVECEDFYDFMKQNPQYFDTGDYDVDHPSGITPQNSKEIGLFKDENKGNPIRILIALRAKLNCYLTDIKSSKTLKGIVKNVKENNVHFIEYLNTVLHNKVCFKKQYTIQSKKHEINVFEQNKVAIAPGDDKVKLLTSLVSVPWGMPNVDMAKINEINDNILSDIDDIFPYLTSSGFL